MTVHFGLLLVGIAFLAACGLLLVKQLKSRRTNTASVPAEVTDYEVQTHVDSEGVTSVSYFPIMRYCVSGQWYEKKSDVGRGRKKYAVGERVEVRYDPKHPENFIIAGDNLALIAAAIGICLGIGITILAFFAG